MSRAMRSAHAVLSDPPRRGPGLALPSLVFVLTAAAFLPAINAGFSDFDDAGFVVQPDGWRGLAPKNLSWIATTMILGHYQPLTYLSYALEYTLTGMGPTLDPRVFHATNIALHAMTAAALARLLARLLAARRDAWGTPTAAECLAGAAGAVLWGVHPLRVESVAWISERRDVLSGLFLVLAAGAYLKAAAGAGGGSVSIRRLWPCIALLALSLLSKAWGITFVAVAVLLDIWPLRRLDWRVFAWVSPARRGVLIEKWPLAVLGLVFAVLAARAQASAADTMKTLSEWGVLPRAGQAAYGLCFYLWKSLWPVNLAALYELPAAIELARWPWWACVAAVTLAGVLIAHASRRRPGVGVAALVYAAVLSPVLGLAQSGIQLVAERYSYLALMPLSALLAAAATPWLGASRSRRRTVLGVVAAAAGTLGVLSWRQSGVWSSTIGLWRQALASGQDGPLLRNYLGRQLEKLGEPDAAVAEYRKSLAFDPNFGDSWFGLGNTHRKAGRFGEALPAFEAAASRSKDPTRAWMAIGLIYVQDLNRPTDGIAALTKAVEATERAGNPARTGSPYLLLGAAYGAAGDDAKAIEWLRRAITFADTRPYAEQHLRDLGVHR